MPTLPLVHLPSLLGGHGYYGSMFLHNPLLPPSLLYSHLYPNHFHSHLHNSDLHSAVAAHLAANRTVTPRPDTPSVESDKNHPEDCTIKKPSPPPAAPAPSKSPNVTSARSTPPRPVKKSSTDVWRPY